MIKIKCMWEILTPLAVLTGLAFNLGSKAWKYKKKYDLTDCYNIFKYYLPKGEMIESSK